MKTRVTVVDYGMGNLFSATKALEHCGAEVLLTSDAERIAGSERVVLPGVGAFFDGMRGLKAGGLDAAVKTFAKKGGSLLGICLGMQMLMETSEEFGLHEGLGLVPGRVTAIPRTGQDGKPHKIPHIGWNSLEIPSARKDLWEGTILADIQPGEPMYFVHSFTAVPADERHRLADSFYDGCRIAGAIRNGKIYGCQFHPEKSGKAGLKIIENFLRLK